MSDFVPDDVLRNILSRLPVAPLLRFRCVSKSWKGLIDSPQFVKHHLNHSHKTNSNLNIIISSRRHHYFLDFDLLNDTNQAHLQKLPHPLRTFGGYQVEVVGSCDGLLVLRNTRERDTIFRNTREDDTILWNPSVRRFHALPCSCFEYSRTTIYGFGYDVVSDDYKLIRIAQLHGMYDYKFNSQAKVYSLKSDSWRRIPDFPYHVRTNGQHANGALHWIVEEIPNKLLIAAFDLGTEDYRLVPLPNFLGNVNAEMDLVVLGGCLSLMCSNGDHVDLWVMKEYGVEESWSISFAFDIVDRDYAMPLVFSKCGRKLFLELGDQFLWYDLDQKSTDEPKVEMPPETMYEIHTGLQSLVLLNNGKCDFDMVAEIKQERKDKKRKCRTKECRRFPVKFCWRFF